MILASLLAGFILGVLLFSYFTAPVSYLFVGVSVVVSFEFFRRVRKVVSADAVGFAMVFLLGIAIGAYRLSIAVPGDQSVFYETGETREISGVIMKRESGEETQKVLLSDLVIDGEEKADNMYLFLPKHPEMHLGDEVALTCPLETPEPFDGFAYDRFLAAKHIYATCYSRTAPKVLTPGKRHGVLIKIRQLHEKAVLAIEQVYGEPHAQLLAGLLFGDDNFRDAEKELFMRTGTSHVVAASGYNIALVSSLALAFLIYAGIRRQYAFPFVLLAITLFVIFAGAEAAVTRAGIMGAVAITATQFGRKSSGRNTLLLVSAVMLMIEPRILRDDAGFQLSVLSTAGLMVLSRPLSERLAFIPETFGLRESFTSTLAATLFTLPVIIFGFGRISLVGPLTNLLVLPFLPYAMAAGAFGVAAHFLAALPPFLGGAGEGILALPGWFFLELIIRIIHAMSDLPFAVLSL